MSYIKQQIKDAQDQLEYHWMQCQNQETGSSPSTTPKRSLNFDTPTSDMPATKKRLGKVELITSKDTLNSPPLTPSLELNDSQECLEPTLNLEEELPMKLESTAEKMEDGVSMKLEPLEVIDPLDLIDKEEFWEILRENYVGEGDWNMRQNPAKFKDLMRKNFFSY